MKNSAYQIGIIKDVASKGEDTNVFDLILDIVDSARNIKESYNSPASVDVRFEDLSISTATSLSYAIWHEYNKVIQSRN